MFPDSKKPKPGNKENWFLLGSAALPYVNQMNLSSFASNGRLELDNPFLMRQIILLYV
jgi:hypothetical protein